MLPNSRVIFFGTPKIAQRCLQALLDKSINVVAIVTKPDAPIGRKQIITPSEVKLLAQQRNIPILQPNKLSTIVEEIKNLKPDLIVSCAYGKIIPESILNIPQYHCVNVHTSLLPRWRGGAPIHHAILNGDSKTGVTLMYMDKGLDTGNIIFQESIKIDDDETHRSLYEKLSNLSYNLLTKHIEMLFNTNVISTKQDNALATIAPTISVNDEKINWHATTNEIDAKIRGLYDVPIAYTLYDNNRIKVLKASKIKNIKDAPGKIIKIDKDGILVGCNDGGILLEQIQLPSKTPIFIKDLINGKHLFKIGAFFL